MPQIFNQSQIDAFQQIRHLMATHFDGAIVAVLVENPNDATKEHMEFSASGSPSRNIALSQLLVGHCMSKFTVTPPHGSPEAL